MLYQSDTSHSDVILWKYLGDCGDRYGDGKEEDRRMRWKVHVLLCRGTSETDVVDHVIKTSP